MAQKINPAQIEPVPAFRASFTGVTGNLAYTGATISFTEVFDTGGNFDASGFTAPYAGVYFFVTEAGIDNQTGRLVCRISVNGSTASLGFMYAGASNNDPVVSTSTVVQLAAGEVVSVLYGSEVASQTLTSACLFSGHLVTRTQPCPQ